MVRLYALTPLGKRLARGVNLPETEPNVKVVRFLDQVGMQTPEQIADGTGLDSGTAAASLAQLKRGGIVGEVGGRRESF